MNGASKILTVSYGTFSCTLEGFNDPFDTMKAIAEYFRDLAAEDRYFGAEPPQPDAAMLHRIAEREIQRRVVARVEDNSVHLRPSEPESAMPEHPAPAAPELLTQAAANDSVAARLARLRAQNAPPQATPAPAGAAFWPDEAYVEDQHSEQDLGSSSPMTENAAAFTAPEPIQEKPQDAEPAVAAPSVAETDVMAVVSPNTGTASESDLDLDVEAEAEAVAEITAPGVEPVAVEDDEYILDPATFAVEETSSQPEVELAPAVTEAASLPLDHDDDAILGNIMSALGTTEAPGISVPSPEATAPATAEAYIEAAEFSAITMQDVDDQPAPEFSGMDLSDAPAAEPAAEAEAAPETIDVAPASVVAEPEMPAPLQRARARVIRIRRADAEALQPIAHEAIIETVAPALAASPVGNSGLSAEAEADLLAELAALEEDAAPASATSAPVITEIVSPRRPTSAARRSDGATGATTIDAKAEPVAAPSAEATRTAEAELERIIAQANSALGDANNQRRHSAIQHLKAAVAATEADRAAKGGMATDLSAPEANYRQDLNRAVGGSSAQGQKSAERSTPLVLVSAQRIDRPAAETPASGRILPVRPMRRASRSASAAEALRPEEIEVHAPLILTGGPNAAPKTEDPAERAFTAESFPEFARLLGAVSLVEQMEAAAVYRATVQDQPAFRRAALSSVISSLGGPELTREAFFAAFEQLLAKGYLTEIEGGRYALTDRSPYLQIVENED